MFYSKIEIKPLFIFQKLVCVVNYILYLLCLGTPLSTYIEVYRAENKRRQTYKKRQVAEVGWWVKKKSS